MSRPRRSVPRLRRSFTAVESRYVRDLGRREREAQPSSSARSAAYNPRNSGFDGTLTNAAAGTEVPAVAPPLRRRSTAIAET